jgi:hypothetical protein
MEKKMETKQVVSQDPVQELKSERVQEELVAAVEEPFWISLKSERVQEPALAAAGMEATVASLYELSFNQMSVVTVRLAEPQAVITLHATGRKAA